MATGEVIVETKELHVYVGIDERLCIVVRTPSGTSQKVPVDIQVLDDDWRDQLATEPVQAALIAELTERARQEAAGAPFRLFQWEAIRRRLGEVE